jgi:hypothetical protein
MSHGGTEERHFDSTVSAVTAFCVSGAEHGCGTKLPLAAKIGVQMNRLVRVFILVGGVLAFTLGAQAQMVQLNLRISKTDLSFSTV